MRWALPIWLPLLVACGSDQTLVVVTVDGLTPDVQGLRATITLDGKKTRQPQLFDMPLSTFGLQLPAGARGDFVLDLEALDGHACVVATGQGETTTAGESRVRLEVSLTSQTPQCRWSRRIGGPSMDFARSIAVDGSGASIVTGDVQDTVDFGDGVPTQSAGGFDAFVAKFSPAGDLLWVHRFGGPGDDSGAAVKTDGAGNIFLAGYFQDTVSFGGPPLASTGKRDIFLAMYSPAGDHLWSRRLGGPEDDEPNAMALGDGAVFLAGQFHGMADLGGKALTSAGDADVFVARYTAGGELVWAASGGGPGFDSAYALAFDGHGGVGLAGSFVGTASFGGNSITSQGMTDVFVARYAKDGTYMWSQGHGGPDNDVASAIVADSAGNLVVTGYFSGLMVDFGGGTPLHSASTQPDVFLAKYDLMGNYQWAEGWGGPGDDEAFAMAPAGDDSVAICGIFNDGANFGGAVLHTFNGTSHWNAVAARYSVDGKYQWARNFGGADDTRCWGVALDSVGNVLLTGDFAGQADLGTGPQQSAGDTDVFVLRMAQ